MSPFQGCLAVTQFVVWCCIIGMILSDIENNRLHVMSRVLLRSAGIAFTVVLAAIGNVLVNAQT
jgi:hypothetical protein